MGLMLPILGMILASSVLSWIKENNLQEDQLEGQKEVLGAQSKQAQKTADTSAKAQKAITSKMKRDRTKAQRSAVKSRAQAAVGARDDQLAGLVTQMMMQSMMGGGDQVPTPQPAPPPGAPGPGPAPGQGGPDIGALGQELEGLSPQMVASLMQDATSQPKTMTASFRRAGYTPDDFLTGGSQSFS